MMAREVDVSSKLTFNPKTRRRSSTTRRRPTKLYFNPTSFNLRIKHIFPKLDLGNFLKLKRRRVGEDEGELTNGFSLILEQEIKLEVETRACNSYFLFPSTIFSSSLRNEIN